MQRFILIDQSITGLGGHHYEYARRVLDAAREAGYQPVLATNRKCRQQCGDFPVHPAYQFGFWHRSAAPRWWTGLRNLQTRLARPWFLLQIRVLLSPIGEVWANRRNALECLRRSGHLSLPHRLLLIALFAALYVARLAAGGVQFLGQCVPFRGYLAQVAAAVRRFAQVAVGPWLRYAARPQDVLKMLHAWRKSRAFGRDTLRVLRQVRPADGDVVFIPTLEENEMLGLLQCLAKLPAARRLAWHLLFRRNIYVGRGVDYVLQDENQRPLRNAFRAFQRRLDGADVRFYTDTEQLTEQYNRLGVFRFQTLPIPVDPQYRQRESDGGPANVVYVGDARTEKGYQFVPAIVDDLWPRVQRGEICFTLQSNFNSPQGEPSAVVAKAQLQQKRHPAVRLLDRPLTSDEYRDTVLSGDAALVLYDRDNYFARSSGIFTEAMFAGIPVVTPSGSWMALQLEPAIRAYHRQLEQRSAWRLDQLDGAALNWRLLGGGRVPRGSVDLRLAGPQSRWTWLRPPVGADHLVLSCRPQTDRSGHFLHVHLNAQDANRTETAACDHVIGGLSGAETSVLIPLPEGTRRLWLGLRGAYSHHPLVLRDLRVTWLQAGRPLPRSAAGVLVDRLEEASQAVREILDHSGHYRATAAEFSRAWSAVHQPRTLVQQLTGLSPMEGGLDLPRPHFLVPHANSVRRTA